MPGDVIDLPAAYEGEKWLEVAEPKHKAVAAPSKVEVAPEVTPVVSLSDKKLRKKA